MEGDKVVNLLPPIPYLDQIIASASDEPPSTARLGLTAHKAARRGCGGPAHRVDAQPVRREDFVFPAALVELEYANAAVGRGARE